MSSVDEEYVLHESWEKIQAFVAGFRRPFSYEVFLGDYVPDVLHGLLIDAFQTVKIFLYRIVDDLHQLPSHELASTDFPFWWSLLVLFYVHSSGDCSIFDNHKIQQVICFSRPTCCTLRTDFPSNIPVTFSLATECITELLNSKEFEDKLIGNIGEQETSSLLAVVRMIFEAKLDKILTWQDPLHVAFEIGSSSLDRAKKKDNTYSRGCLRAFEHGRFNVGEAKEDKLLEWDEALLDEFVLRVFRALYNNADQLLNINQQKSAEPTEASVKVQVEKEISFKMAYVSLASTIMVSIPTSVLGFLWTAHVFSPTKGLPKGLQVEKNIVSLFGVSLVVIIMCVALSILLGIRKKAREAGIMP